MPGLITAGTFHLEGERIFWDVHEPRKPVVIELMDNPCRRLVIEVPDPRPTVTLIERSLQPA